MVSVRIQIVSRGLLLICLLTATLLLAGCSYLTEFVIVNASDQPIKVQYQVKKPPNPQSPNRLPMSPEVKAASQLQKEVEWRELSASQYSFDPDTRIAIIQLMPGEAVRIEVIDLVDKQDSDIASRFAIEEIDISGANGEIKLQGEQARKSFVPESKQLYTLTYH
jgi:hypothetical protein